VQRAAPGQGLVELDHGDDLLAWPTPGAIRQLFTSVINALTADHCTFELLPRGCCSGVLPRSASQRAEVPTVMAMKAVTELPGPSAISADVAVNPVVPRGVSDQAAPCPAGAGRMRRPPLDKPGVRKHWVDPPHVAATSGSASPRRRRPPPGLCCQR